MNSVSLSKNAKNAKLSTVIAFTRIPHAIDPLAHSIVCNCATIVAAIMKSVIGGNSHSYTFISVRIATKVPNSAQRGEMICHALSRSQKSVGYCKPRLLVNSSSLSVLIACGCRTSTPSAKQPERTSRCRRSDDNNQSKSNKLPVHLSNLTNFRLR